MKQLITALIVFFAFFSKSQESLDYFLPQNVSYNENIPTPESYFNQQVGQWHLTHDQVLFYMKEIAKVSKRAIVYEYARTHENRPLIHLVFTSEKNQQNLEKLKELHFNFSEPGIDINKNEVPLVVSLTYGIHGNESSATNSSVLTAYYLAASEGEKIDKLLDKTIIIVDPCLNPDGFTRHSTWANIHQGATPSTSNDSRQFDEVWPGGRTNHYWFDLNRDYLLLVHPESKGKVAKFHDWKPNIVTDHHEMSANSTFFFQPGVPSRNNPLTPVKNYELTHEIAKYHAKFLDSIGSAYFSEERFDDYYFGKGSSYPDVNGSIGILFEQAGFRGRIRETENGIKKLAFGIKNQFAVSLSTLEAAANLHDELLEMQKEFFNSAITLADEDEIKAYVFANNNDNFKTQNFIELLNQHQIQVYQSKNNVQINNQLYPAEKGYIVPLKQKQYRLIKTIFEEVSEFSDTTFYDVSTWTFPYAYNIPFKKITSLKNISYSSEPVQAKNKPGEIFGGKSSLGYLFRWNEFNAPTALYHLQKTGLTAKVATESFVFEFNGQTEHFNFGTILIPATNENLNENQIFEKIKQVSQNTGIDFYGLETGLSPQGIDMGSDNFLNLAKPEILMFVGGSQSSSDAGEIWHLFDQRYQIPVTLAESENIGSINLDRYSAIILPGGSYREWDKNDVDKLKNWVAQGGSLIAYKSAAVWASQNNLGKTKFKKSVQPDTARFLSYADRSKEYSYNSMSGAIFKVKMDISHPLCYGYLNPELSIFKSGTSVAESLEIKHSEPVNYSSDPFVSGWVSPENLERIKNAPVISVQSAGRGNIISYYDNMNFRGTWLGTSKLFSNSVFFGGIIR